MEQQTKGELLKIYRNQIMSYDWGSTDPNCLIAQLSDTSSSKYAQLWMGIHPNGPSLLTPSKTLSQHCKIRFLFKILCIQKCLSLQIHPSKSQAEQLHKDFPEIYKDSSDKPEMFLTLSDFECFLGFIDQKQLDRIMKQQPFCWLGKQSENPKDIISALLKLDQIQNIKYIQRLQQNIQKIHIDRKQLLQKLSLQFPNDSGLLVSCLLHYKKLPANSCMGIDSGIPHAYISGSCFEIMNNSDNVIRLGLTKKLKDSETMLKTMRNQAGLDGVIVPQILGEYKWNGFTIKCLVWLEQSSQEVSLKEEAIGIVIKGKINQINRKVELKKGYSFFLEKGGYNFKGLGQLYIGNYQ